MVFNVFIFGVVVSILLVISLGVQTLCFPLYFWFGLGLSFWGLSVHFPFLPSPSPRLCRVQCHRSMCPRVVPVPEPCVTHCQDHYKPVYK